MSMIASIWVLFSTFPKALASGKNKPANEGILEGMPCGMGKGTRRLGVADDGKSYVYMVSGGSPEANMKSIIEMMGGIDRFVGKDDVVILKPNVQWWNQGMTNTDSMKAFIEAVLSMPGFQGEIIIADNHQFQDKNSRAWSTEKRNGSFNYNELIEHFHERGKKNVTKYHWICAGQNPKPLQGDASGGRRVKGPSEGDGYVWRDDIVYKAPNGHICWMTYPIFTSQYSGCTIDLKDGVWEQGRYNPAKKIKFINFSALNHHSQYAGVTASIKNLMGVADMTCGFQGTEPAGTYNMHYVGFSDLIRYKGRIHWRLSYARTLLEKIARRNFHYTAGALGTFMKTIIMPDLNIITAEWVGWGSRTDINKSARPKALLASTDPVALDFIAAKYILLPSTPKYETGYAFLNDPAESEGPFYKFLKSCWEQGVGNLDQNNIVIERN